MPSSVLIFRINCPKNLIVSKIKSFEHEKSTLFFI